MGRRPRCITDKEPPRRVTVRGKYAQPVEKPNTERTKPMKTPRILKKAPKKGKENTDDVENLMEVDDSGPAPPRRMDSDASYDSDTPVILSAEYSRAPEQLGSHLKIHVGGRHVKLTPMMTWNFEEILNVLKAHPNDVPINFDQPESDPTVLFEVAHQTAKGNVSIDTDWILKAEHREQLIEKLRSLKGLKIPVMTTIGLRIGSIAMSLTQTETSPPNFKEILNVLAKSKRLMEVNFLDHENWPIVNEFMDKDFSAVKGDAKAAEKPKEQDSSIEPMDTSEKHAKQQREERVAEKSPNEANDLNDEPMFVTSQELIVANEVTVAASDSIIEVQAPSKPVANDSQKELEKDYKRLDVNKMNINGVVKSIAAHENVKGSCPKNAKPFQIEQHLKKIGAGTEKPAGQGQEEHADALFPRGVTEINNESKRVSGVKLVVAKESYPLAQSELIIKDQVPEEPSSNAVKPKMIVVEDGDRAEGNNGSSGVQRADAQQMPRKPAESQYRRDPPAPRIFLIHGFLREDASYPSSSWIAEYLKRIGCPHVPHVDIEKPDDLQFIIGLKSPLIHGLRFKVKTEYTEKLLMDYLESEANKTNYQNYIRNDSALLTEDWNKERLAKTRLILEVSRKLGSFEMIKSPETLKETASTGFEAFCLRNKYLCLDVYKTMNLKHSKVLRVAAKHFKQNFNFEA